jgi:hypothetical protein
VSIAEDYLTHLDAEMQEDDTFTVTDDSKADWCCRKITQAQKRIEERKAYVQAEIERLKTWQKEQDEKDEATIGYMESLLKPYFDHLRESGALGRSKSYKLPHGILQSRKAQPKWERDDKQLVEWARQYNLTKVEEVPKWSEIVKRLKPVKDMPGALAVDELTGEIVTGVQLEQPAEDKFSVKGVE